MNAQEVIARALALSEAATDGPWIDGGQGWVFAPGTVPGRDPHDEMHDLVLSACNEADVAFAAAARTLLPAFAKALGDVLDKHRDVTMLDGSHTCSTCTTVHHDFGWPSVASEPYPCPTRRAITAALSEVTQ